MSNKIKFHKTTSSEGKQAFEMRISGTPWGRFDTKQDGLSWAKLNNLA